MRVLVCGGRDFNDRAQVWDALDGLDPAPTTIINGGASGADMLAKAWARERGVDVVTYMAEWSLLGKKAGPLRNSRMLSHGEPSLVVAFPGGRGTADMVRKARRAGVPVIQPGAPT